MRLRIFIITLAAIVVSACTPTLPFRHQVASIIPDDLKIKAPGITENTINVSRAKAFSLNDFGHVAGIYTPIWKRVNPEKRKIFIYSEGKLNLYDSPCKNNQTIGISRITNTLLIAGFCENFTDPDLGYTESFVYSYASGQLKELTPSWPTKGYKVIDINDRGDAIGSSHVIGGYPQKRNRPPEFLGFIYVSGILHMVKQSDLQNSTLMTYAKLGPSGEVFGGSTKDVIDRLTDKPKKLGFFSFINGKIDQTTHETRGEIKAINSSGISITSLGILYDLKDGTLKYARTPGDDYLYIYNINDNGWILGGTYDHYPIPPFGASLGHIFLSIDGKFYNVESSTGKRSSREEFAMLGNNGHILIHSEGWPYLITPENIKNIKASKK